MPPRRRYEMNTAALSSGEKSRSHNSSSADSKREVYGRPGRMALCREHRGRGFKKVLLSRGSLFAHAKTEKCGRLTMLCLDIVDIFGGSLSLSTV